MPALLLIAYGVVLVMLLALENRLVFPVDPASRRLAEPDPRMGLRPERVSTVTQDGVRLVGWAMSGPDAAARWMLMFHGNSGNIASDGRPEHYERLRALGLNLITFDYRGYGEILRDSLRVPADRIVIFGHSLGSAVAVDLASRVPARGLVVEGAFSSGPDAAQRIYWFLPVRLVMRSRFASADKIAAVAAPKLFLHAREDEVIPFDLGRKLFEQAPGPKRFVALGGGHNDAYLADSASYFGAIADFLR